MSNNNVSRIEISGIVGNGEFSNISAIYKNGGQIYGDRVHTYAVSVSVENGDYVGSLVFVEGKVLNIAFKPNEGYTFPASVSVQNANFTYNSGSGIVSIFNAVDNITVTASCVRRYTITATLVDAEADINNPTFIDENTEVVLAFHFTAPYSCPTAAPAVVGATRVWSKLSATQGQLTLTNPTGNVSFTITGYMPTLGTPQVYLSSASVVSITEVANAESYAVYVDGVKVATVQPNNA